MIKAFLVEDETVIREGLRDNIPWNEFGYELVGEATDGEMALPLIRKHHPDVLITDIKMPFMDGLSLSRIVSEEFPDMKIIVISGYDDFDYARQAIEVGVEQYLLKPITKNKLTKVLIELKEKIEQSQEQQDYQAKYLSEIHEYEQFSLRRFFERLFEGGWQVKEIYEEAAKLELDIAAQSYNLLLIYIRENNEDKSFEEKFTGKEEEIVHFFLRNPEYLMCRLNLHTYGVLVKGDSDSIRRKTRKGIEHVKDICEGNEDMVSWYVAVGEYVERLSMLSACYQKANMCFACRFIMPKTHILEEGTIDSIEMHPEQQGLENIDSGKMSPEIIKEFLQKGEASEIDSFVQSYLMGIQDALETKMIKDYVILNIRFATISYMESLGITQGEFLQKIEENGGLSTDDISQYIVTILGVAIDIRDRKSDDQISRLIRMALDYIDENFTKESLSLNTVANYIHISPNYFSAAFSQNMRMTFVEYVTKKRMDMAKKLLRTSDLMAGEIAFAVGYKDSHYFSFVFKKTVGISPREYRSGKRVQGAGEKKPSGKA
ncbi:MAG: response regulator [Lachnospiraceae bacterium]|nr:response regulator [Lachnospiraceae bacterium]